MTTHSNSALSKKKPGGSVCVEPLSGVLSNYEVYKFLSNARDDSNQKQQSFTSNQLTNFATIAYEVVLHLQDTPSSVQTPESIENFLKSVQHLPLTKIEKLGLVNIRPKSPPELCGILGSHVNKFTDEQIEEIIELVVKHLPEPVVEEESSNE